MKTSVAFQWVNQKIFPAFYTVHPSLWTRVTTWWFSTFLAPAIKHKIHNIHEVGNISYFFRKIMPAYFIYILEISLQVKELDSVINSTEFDIPMFIQVGFCKLQS